MKPTSLLVEFFAALNLVLIPLVFSEKILVLFPLASGSESWLVVPLVEELLAKGHKVTLVSPVETKLNSANFTEIRPVPKMETTHYYPDVAHKSFLEQRELGRSFFKQILTFDIDMIYRRCHEVYQHPEFQKLYKYGSFDLLIISGQMNTCFFGLAHTFQAPWMAVRSHIFTSDIMQFPGLRMPSSFVSNVLVEALDEMDFFTRVLNTLARWMYRYGHYIATSPDSTAVYRKYLGQAEFYSGELPPDTPDLLEIEREVGIILSNSYFPLNFPLPLTPDVVEIGGMHCRDPKPLPNDLQVFLDDAKEGFVFFSMGSMFKSSSFPPDLTEAFLTIFSRRNQKLLWTTDMEFTNLPSNIRVGKFFPQQDVLGHPNCRLFITHGGSLSYFEAVYHAVPLIAIPIWADQCSNAIKIQKFGNGVSLDVAYLKYDVLDKAINDILNNRRYKAKALEMSNILKDQPQSPLQRATYWAEYLLRYRNSTKTPIRSGARDLNSLQYHSIDVITFIIIVPFSICFIVIKISKYYLRAVL